VAAGIRQAVHSIDKDLPVTDVESFPDALGASVTQERFRTLPLRSWFIACRGSGSIFSPQTEQRPVGRAVLTGTFRIGQSHV
jgi:hypothetical protein